MDRASSVGTSDQGQHLPSLCRRSRKQSGSLAQERRPPAWCDACRSCSIRTLCRWPQVLLVAAVTIEVDKESKLLPICVPKKDSVTGLAAIKEALTLCNDHNLHQITGSRIIRIQADGGGEFNNQKLKELCFDKNINLSFSPAHQLSSNGIAERLVGMLKSTVRRASPLRARMVVICVQICGSHDARRSTRQNLAYPLFGQLVGIWKGHDKDQAKSLDDRGAAGYLIA